MRKTVTTITCDGCGLQGEATFLNGHEVPGWGTASVAVRASTCGVEFCVSLDLCPACAPALPSIVGKKIHEAKVFSAALRA